MASEAKLHRQARGEVRFPSKVLNRLDLIADSVSYGILQGARERARIRGAGAKVTRVNEVDVLDAALATLRSTIPKLDNF